MMKLHPGDRVEYFDEVYGRREGTVIRLAKDVGSIGHHLYLTSEHFTEPLRYLPKQKLWMTTGMYECVVERLLAPAPRPVKKMNPKLKRFLKTLRFWFKFEFLTLPPKVVAFAQTVPNEFATTTPNNVTNVTAIVKNHLMCSNTSIATKRKNKTPTELLDELLREYGAQADVPYPRTEVTDLEYFRAWVDRQLVNRLIRLNPTVRYTYNERT